MPRPNGSSARTTASSPSLGVGERVVWGALAGLFIGLFEVLYVALAVPLAFDETAERVRFSLCTLGVDLGGGTLAGLLLGIGHAGLVRLARRFGDGPGDGQPGGARTLAWLYTAAAAPLLAWLAVLVFDGRRMRALPGRPFYIALVTLVFIALARLVARLGPALFERLQRDGKSGLRAVVATALFALGVVLCLANARVLPRLYLYFHVALSVFAQLAFMGAAAATLALARRPHPRARYIVLATLALGLWAGRWGVRQYAWWPILRAVAFEETRTESQLLGAAVRLHVAPRAVTPPERLPEAPAPAQDGPRLPPGPRVPDADFFLITVDAMRADRLSPKVAPRLDAIAAEGTRFDRAYAQVPHTSFSLTTLLTGKYAYALAAIGADLAAPETLADLFRRERYKTAAFFPPSVFFIDHDRFTALEENRFHFEYARYEYMDAPGRTDQVIHFLEAEKPERVFAWVHYFDPHEPYAVHQDLAPGPGGTPAPTAASTAMERYDGEVRYVDREVGRLVDYIRAHRPRAVIVFSADHGEEFGEHGGRYHGSTLYEEQVRVPLFFVGPGIPARRVSGPVGLIDVAPTLLALSDQLPSARLRGRDLGPWMSTDPSVTAPRALLEAHAELGGKKLLASEDDRLVCDLGRDYCELYDLVADPDEKRNLAGRSPARVAALRARLEAFLASHSRYEQTTVPGLADVAEAAQRALERCRLGDITAAREVSGLLANSDGALSASAARCLLALPTPHGRLDAGVKAAIASAHRARPDDPLCSALALRAGDASLVGPMRTAAAAEPSPLDEKTRVEVALTLAGLAARGGTEDEAGAAASITLLGRILPTISDEEERKRAIALLGASGRKEAFAPLAAAVGDVRLGAEVVRALGTLGDRRAAPVLADRLPEEPYVTARVEEARVLGELGDSRSAAVLARTLRTETEPAVRAALQKALQQLRHRR